MKLEEATFDFHGRGDLSGFMEMALRGAVEFRAVQNEFHARGKQSSDNFDATGLSYSTDEVIAKLSARTQLRRKQLFGK